MRTLVLKKRQDHDTLLSRTAASGSVLLLAALTALPWQAAPAQGPCTAITDDAERLACYDRALRGAPPATTPPPAAAAPTQNTAPAAAAPAAAAPAAAAAAAPITTQPERTVRESTAPAAPAAPVAGGTRAEPQIVPLVIVDWRALPGREANFTAQDGSIWIQTDSQRLTGIPDPPFDAELKPGAMGSYFLVPKEQGRAIRVRSAR